jgi:hypothetical protein
MAVSSDVVGMAIAHANLFDELEKTTDYTDAMDK